jgi:hypothetical protein
LGFDCGVLLRGSLVVELELATHVIFPVKSLLKWVCSVFWNTPAMQKLYVFMRFINGSS